MSEDGSINAWGIRGKQKAPAITETEEKLRGKYQPSPVTPINESLQKEQELIGGEPGSDLKKAFSLIEAHLDRLHSFTNAERDIGARLIMSVLTPPEINWIKEIAQKIHKRPIWQCFAGWFRYCHENSMAQAPLFDSQWDTKVDFGPGASTCALDECRQSFIPKRYGQMYCSTKCGAVVDKRLIVERIAKQEQPSITA